MTHNALAIVAIDSVPHSFSHASWLWGGLTIFLIRSSFGMTRISTSRS
jgi:hypothetical protein